MHHIIVCSSPSLIRPPCYEIVATLERLALVRGSSKYVDSGSSKDFNVALRRWPLFRVATICKRGPTVFYILFFLFCFFFWNKRFFVFFRPGKFHIPHWHRSDINIKETHHIGNERTEWTPEGGACHAHVRPTEATTAPSGGSQFWTGAKICWGD